ncbi:hypothetical protein [Georgenia daeguensis]|uniref:Phenylacetate--CoA ligase family protein n=1 Tax=Georgenia daeguensis TaxID=908355 RepID=A0ABP8ESP1_9MICO
MDAAALARRTTYWALDRAHGRPVAEAVDEIHAALDDPHDPEVRRLLDTRLAALLLHAVERVPFYRGSDPTDLTTFPVVTKLTFREHGPAMRSRGFAAAALQPHVTSGSTGTPFEAVWDQGKALRNRADTIAMATRAGYRLGMPLIYFRIWGGAYRKGPVQRAREGLTPVDVRSLDDGRAREVLDAVRRRRHPVTLLGYTSALELLCHVLDAGHPGVADRVAAVVAVGEAPTDYLRRAAERHFGTPLVARYSNSENGLVAQEEPGSTGYRVNRASYLVEVLRHDSDRPAGAGEEGRIVLTDLFNRAMPFIRYDTGDRGTLAVDGGGRADDAVLASIAGRSMATVYDTRGRSLNPMGFMELSRFTDVRQFQVAQTGPGRYTLRLNASPDAGRDTQIRAQLLDALGADADLVITYVEEVPLLASGKRQVVVNEWQSAH